MIKVENIDSWGFEHAVRGMRNPLNSWEKSDSYFLADDGDAYDILGNTRPWPDEMYVDNVVLGLADLTLMARLYRFGREHRKYLRQIFVSMDITAPLYWWKEFDTYKIGTTANSCSTMHKIAAKEFTIDDFSHEHLITDFEYPEDLDDDSYLEEYCLLKDKYVEGLSCDYMAGEILPIYILDWIIQMLNRARELFLKTKSKKYWWQMIQLLPSSYNQKRTVTMNYENVMNIIDQRTAHKLDEWVQFVSVLKTLPYISEIRGEVNG